MSITEPIKQFQLKTLPGMNNLYEDLDLKNKWVEGAYNCRFENEPGAIDKRDPVTYFNSTSTGAGAVVGLYRLYTSTGIIKFIKIHGTKAYVGDDSTGTWTEIRSNLTNGKRMAFATYQDKCIMSNGFDDMFVYDGASTNTTWELGACKATLGTGSGNLDANADYYYAVTFDNDAVVNGAISNVITTDGTNQKIELSNIPLGPIGTVNRKIYRTEGGGTSLLLLTTITDNTTTTYFDNTADGSLGVAYPSITDDMPKGNILKVHRERLFISGDPNGPNKIYFSNVYLPHYIQQTTNLDYMEISPEDGDEIMGIPVQLGTMLCIKKNTIRKLHITSAVSGADPNTWYADDPVSFVGSPAQWSITQTPFGIAFLGWDHWYMFDGQNTIPIIDEFDTKEILPADYHNTVGFYHKGILLAAYSDLTIAAQFHNRIMRYNFRRKALSIDYWTSSTISGANCFASKTGDDETGELYYGDSQNGYVVKNKTSEDSYRLRTKTECNEGTKTDIFVGGLENAPYIEIGSGKSASAIPDDICIFWDDSDTTPGPNWTEVSTSTEYYILINSTAGTISSGSSHTHSLSGSTNEYDSTRINSGDGTSNGTVWIHGHTASVTSDSSTPGPRYTKLRVFKASSETATEFPDGSIVMWDQPTAPTGWQNLIDVSSVTSGYYVRMAKTGLAESTSSSHSHSYSGTTGQDDSAGGGESDSGTDCPQFRHTHTFSGSVNSVVQDSWELDYCSFTFIKKSGESDSWDGSSKYIYCLYDGSGTPSGWTEVTSTYSGKYLKVGPGAVPATGSTANASHTHSASAITTSQDTQHWGNGGYHAQCQKHHTHLLTWSSISSTSSGVPASRTFRLFKKLLGKMKEYNDGIETQYTSGTWVSSSQQINAEALDKMSWNETVSGSDDVILYTRTGSTQSACESAAWSTGLTDPNGSDISSTADVWMQYKIELTASDTRVSNPRVSFTDAFVVKYTYEKGATNAESSVNWVYDIGFRNLDTPLQDKFFKKLSTQHEGDTNSFIVEWETDKSNNSFTVALASYPKMWETYFQDTAIGKEIKLKFSKNDLYPFRLSEIKGVYSEYPAIL